MRCICFIPFGVLTSQFPFRGLIFGGSGGVGTIAIQVIVWRENLYHYWVRNRVNEAILFIIVNEVVGNAGNFCCEF